MRRPGRRRRDRITLRTIGTNETRELSLQGIQSSNIVLPHIQDNIPAPDLPFQPNFIETGLAYEIETEDWSEPFPHEPFPQTFNNGDDFDVNFQETNDVPSNSDRTMESAEFWNYQPFNNITDKKQLFIVEEPSQRWMKHVYCIVFIQATSFQNGDRILSCCSHCPYMDNYSMILAANQHQSDPGLKTEFFNGCPHVATVLLQLYLNSIQGVVLSLTMADVENHLLSLMQNENTLDLGIK
jgi:hypothetical protein